MELFTTFLSIAAASLLLYYFFVKHMFYFKELGILYVPPVPLIGNMGPYILGRMAVMEILQKFYKRFSHVRYFGFYSFTSPIIVMRDPELISLIAVKNFDNFCDHRSFVDETVEPLMAKNLFSLCGDHWRETRRVLSPTFTSSKMKTMFNLICQCAQNFTDYIHEDTKIAKVMDVKDALSRYTNDVVASCAFGINIDSMRDRNNEFYTLSRRTMNFDSILSLKFLIGQNFPKFVKFLRVRPFGEEITRFFTNVVEQTIKIRQERGIVRPDMIQLLMESREKGAPISTLDITAQAFVFFLAGFDSTATIASFIIHELAVNPDIQTKLRKEIETVMKETGGDPTYETIIQMKYLDATINEVLRLYPLVVYLDRVCVKEFELPPASPGGKPVILKPGSTIWFPTYSLHRDPVHFPNPDKFMPERFIDGNVNTSTYIPFGIGPRICIGNRFALMELKVLIFYLLSRCEIEPCEKTTIPMVFSERSFTILPKNGFWLKFRARDQSCNKLNGDVNYEDQSIEA